MPKYAHRAPKERKLPSSDEVLLLFDRLKPAESSSLRSVKDISGNVSLWAKKSDGSTSLVAKRGIVNRKIITIINPDFPDKRILKRIATSSQELYTLGWKRIKMEEIDGLAGEATGGITAV